MNFEFTEKDWTEDFTNNENCYCCECAICKDIFYGYKRRVICKICYKAQLAKELGVKIDFL